MQNLILQLMCAVVLITAVHAQQSHWATADDKTAKFMIDMERKWAEGVCTNNGVIAELLAGGPFKPSVGLSGARILLGMRGVGS